MASIVRGTRNSRYNASIRFPEGSAPKLHQERFPRVVKLFDRIDVPERAFLWSDHKALADFVAINAKRAVCPEVKEAIEALEPGRHQYFAVEIVRGSGRKPIFRLDGRSSRRHTIYSIRPCDWTPFGSRNQKSGLRPTRSGRHLYSLCLVKRIASSCGGISFLVTMFGRGLGSFPFQCSSPISRCGLSSNANGRDLSSRTSGRNS